jgi:integrase/recombinase XerD
LAKYSEEAGLVQNLSPHKLRHFLLNWLKKQGIDDALIQPYSGHESRKSLEIYSKLAITDAQQEYNEVIICPWRQLRWYYPNWIMVPLPCLTFSRT